MGEMQEMRCFHSGLFFYGIFKIMEHVDKFKEVLKNHFEPVFINPIDDWDKIRRIFEPFGSAKYIESSSYSKHPDNEDGTRTPFQLNAYDDGIAIMMCKMAVKLNVLKKPEDFDVDFKEFPISSEDRSKIKKMQAIASQYTTIRNDEFGLFATMYAVCPFMFSDKYIDRSPSQIKLYMNGLVKTSITQPTQYGNWVGTYTWDAVTGQPSPTPRNKSVLHRIPWGTITNFFSEMLDILNSDYWYKIIGTEKKLFRYENVTAPLFNLPSEMSDGDHFYFDTETVLEDIEVSRNDRPLHLNHVTVIPEDSTSDISLELKTCFGVAFNQNTLYPCDECEYFTMCSNPMYIAPHRIHTWDYARIDTRFPDEPWNEYNPDITNNLLNPLPGSRIRVNYKRMMPDSS